MKSLFRGIKNAIKRAYLQRFNPREYYLGYVEFYDIAIAVIDTLDDSLTEFINLRHYLGRLYDKGYSARKAAEKIVKDFND